MTLTLRFFSPAETARRLGLPLVKIDELLSGRLADLDALFALQEVDLRSRRRHVDAALALLTSARA